MKIIEHNLRNAGFSDDEINKFKELAEPINENDCDMTPVVIIPPSGEPLLVAKCMADIAKKIRPDLEMDEPKEEEETECAYCKHGVEEVEEWQNEAVKKYGWYAHFVGNGYRNNMCNIHTHNVQEKFHHPDLQIVVPLPQKQANNILFNLVNKIREGITFSTGEKVNNVVRNMPITFCEAEEDGRKILRIILPDHNGVVDREHIKPPFSMQYKPLENEDED